VLITPYVLLTPEDALEESDRLHRASRASKTPWPKNWSRSPLATPDPKDREAVLQAEKNAADLKAMIERRKEEIRREGLDTSRAKPADVIEVVPVSEAGDSGETETAPPAEENPAAQIPEEMEENETMIADGMVMFDIPDPDEEEGAAPAPEEPSEEMPEETPPPAE